MLGVVLIALSVLTFAAGLERARELDDRARLARWRAAYAERYGRTPKRAPEFVYDQDADE